MAEPPQVERPSPFLGFVLMGGASRRMGEDKAFLVVDGRPLVVHVLSVLPPAGATGTWVVGGDLARFAALGLPVRGIPDDGPPGRGPLAGMLGVLDEIRPPREAVLVFTSCDLPALRSSNVRRLVDGLESNAGLDAAVPVVDGVWQTHVVAIRAASVGRLHHVFAAGERSVRRALATLSTVAVADEHADAYRDLDSPEDVADYARRARTSEPRPPV